jgi:tetratricopeptide (TPR) repeat protein
LGQIYYIQGTEILKDAKSEYTATLDALEKLFAYNQIGSELFEQFEAGPIPLSQFFEYLNKVSSNAFREVESDFNSIESNFKNALSKFNEISPIDPYYIDACVRKSEIYASLGRYEESLAEYKKVEQGGLDRLQDIDPIGDAGPLGAQDSSGKENQDKLRQIVFQIAKLRYEVQGTPTESALPAAHSAAQASTEQPISPEEIILGLVKARKAFLTQQQQKRQNKAIAAWYGFFEEDLYGFLLTEFYKEIGWQSEALRVFNEENNAARPWIESDQELYREVSKQIKKLKVQIDEMNMADILFDVESDIPARIQLINTDIGVTPKEMRFSFLQRWPVVDFMGNMTKKHEVMPIGNYIAVINIKNMEVKKNNTIPFNIQYEYGLGNVLSLLQKAELDLMFTKSNPFKLSPEEYEYNHENNSLLNKVNHKPYSFSGGEEIQMHLKSEWLRIRDSDINYKIIISRFQVDVPIIPKILSLLLISLPPFILR